jgi:hypothetical protein
MRILNAVIAHKDFYWNDLPEEELKKYLVFTYNDIKTNLPNVLKVEKPENLNDNFYSEVSLMKYIRHNMNFDWIVINHYRRRLEIQDYNTLYVPIPNQFDISVKEMYALNHNIEDLNIITDIIMNSDLSPNYKAEWIKSLSDNSILCYNMFSAPKEIFYELIDIFEMIMAKYIKVRNFNTFEDVVNYCDTLQNKNNNHLPYRIGGFISERLTNCYFRNYINKLKLFPYTYKPVLMANVKLLEDGMII